MSPTADGAEVEVEPCPAEFKPVLASPEDPNRVAWSLASNYRSEQTRDAQGNIHIYPHFFTERGRVIRLHEAFPSRELGNRRILWAYLPPSYDENKAARYPVLYMHDGQNLFDATPEQSRFGSWGVDTTLDDLYRKDSSVREVIVIGVANGGTARLREYTPTPGGRGGGDGDAYLDFVFHEVKPFVDGTLRTIPRRETTWMAGSSLGGLISVHGVARRGGADGSMSGAMRWGAYVSRIGAFSPSTWWDGQWILREVGALSQVPPDLLPERVYIDSGDSQTGDDATDTARLAETWRRLGLADGERLQHVVDPGGIHNESAWRRRFPAAFLFLSGHRSSQ